MTVERINELMGNETVVAKPLLVDWGILFKFSDGLENREDIMRCFLKLWNRDCDQVCFIGKCYFSGSVYGRKGFEDGAVIRTSPITTIERIEKRDENGIPNDLMCATTGSGSKYYFYSGNHDAYTFLMLGDLIHTGNLNSRRYYYLSRLFLGSDFL